MSLYRLIIPLGIVTWSLVLITLLSGMKVIKLRFKYHRLLGIISLILASCHGLLVLILNS